MSKENATACMAQSASKERLEKSRAQRESSSAGHRQPWAWLWFHLVICWHCPELTRVMEVKFQSIKWRWEASVLFRNIDWLDKTAGFNWNYRGEVDKLKFGLEHQSQKQLYIMSLRDVMPWSTKKCIFTSHLDSLRVFFRKCPKNLNLDVQTQNCFQQTYFPGELPSFLLQQISSTWLPVLHKVIY